MYEADVEGGERNWVKEVLEELKNVSTVSTQDVESAQQSAPHLAGHAAALQAEIDDLFGASDVEWSSELSCSDSDDAELQQKTKPKPKSQRKPKPECDGNSAYPECDRNSAYPEFDRNSAYPEFTLNSCVSLAHVPSFRERSF